MRRRGRGVGWCLSCGGVEEGVLPGLEVEEGEWEDVCVERGRV